ncbi:MAG: hypothetical protein O3A55_02960 [Bacteroidetes bacterium]|nr:hypothetical protein [Bacteroidota bacterium]
MIKFFWLIIFLINILTAQDFGKAIEDNSFLIEEGINQEDGVVQHISLFDFQENDKFFSFTQEWPILSQTHQLSYTIIANNDSKFLQEFGINYRYQINTGIANLKFAPRFSYFKNFRDDLNSSLQINLPASFRASEKFYFHINLGSNLLKNKSTKTFLSSSTIYLFNETLNLLSEIIIEKVENKFSYTINPGFRSAINLNDLQVVWGLAIPIELQNKTNKRVLFYLSFEHPFN